MGQKALRYVETQEGGLLVGIEALPLVFRHDWGGGLSKTPHCRVETRDGAVAGSGRGQTGKTCHTGRVFPVQHVTDVLGEEGDVLGVVGMCW